MTTGLSRKNNVSRTLQSLIFYKLFELVVVMLVVSALYHTVIGRVMSMRAQYETAEVNWTIASLSSARRTEAAMLRIYDALGRNRGAATKPVIMRNPMLLMSPAPRNYIGELCNPDAREIQRGSWYFDQCNLWLVYVFNSEKIFAAEYPKMIRFNVESLRLLDEPAMRP